MSTKIVKYQDDDGNWVAFATQSHATYHNGITVEDIINCKYNFVYVSNTGNDANDGSYLFPFLTSDKAIEKALSYNDNAFIVTDNVQIPENANYTILTWNKI